MDRPFYDRNQSSGATEPTDAVGDNDPERAEYARHRTMFWELMGDFLADGRYKTWFDRYYAGKADASKGVAGEISDPTQATGTARHPSEFYPGYGLNNESYPFAQLDQTGSGYTNHVLKKAPGLNSPPRCQATGDASTGNPDITEQALDGIHPLFDETQEAFGAARGCYEIWTDIFVDVTDGFRGGYQNGDMRWIFKTPRNDEYKYVEVLNEHLYGLKNGWGWTAIQGTKEHQCETLGGYAFGRLQDAGTFIDYKNDAPRSTHHPSDRDESDGSTLGDAEGTQWEAQEGTANNRYGNWEHFGIVDKTYHGPISGQTVASTVEIPGDPSLGTEPTTITTYNDDEAPLFAGTTDANGNYVTGDLHGILDLCKVGYGAPGTADVVTTEEHKTNKRIWEETKVGADVYMTDCADQAGVSSETTVGTATDKSSMTTSKIWSKVDVPDGGGYSCEEWIEGGMASSRIHGDTDSHTFGRQNEMFLGGTSAFTLAGQAELTVGASAAMQLGLVLDIFIGGKMEVSMGPCVEVSILESKQAKLQERRLVGMEQSIKGNDMMIAANGVNIMSTMVKLGV